MDDEITNAIHDAVFLEANLRHDIFQSHLRDHANVVRKGRIERGLGINDLPEEPAPVKMEVEEEVASSGSNDNVVESNQEDKQ